MSGPLSGVYYITHIDGPVGPQAQVHEPPYAVSTSSEKLHWRVTALADGAYTLISNPDLPLYHVQGNQQQLFVAPDPPVDYVTWFIRPHGDNKYTIALRYTDIPRAWTFKHPEGSEAPVVFLDPLGPEPLPSQLWSFNLIPE